MNRATRNRSSLRPLLLGLGFATALAATLIALQGALDRAQIATPAIQGDTGRLARSIAQSMQYTAGRFDHQIMMLGDSMLLLGSEQKPVEMITSRLERRMQLALAPRRESIRVNLFAQPGAGYTTFYYLADELIAGEPEAIVMEINPLVFSRGWRTGDWARPDLIAWLGATRLPEALGMPLHQLGLTTDRVLWLVACLELGCEELWGAVQRGQLRVVALREMARSNLAAATGWKAMELLRRGTRLATIGLLNRRGVAGKPRRWTEYAYRTRYDEAFAGVPADDISLLHIGATVRRFVTAGIPTLAYITPINVEHMRQLGLYRAQSVDATARVTESVVRAAGGDFVDLHDLLADDDFRDAAGHLTFKGKPNGSARLARELAPRVLSLIGRDPEAQR